MADSEFATAWHTVKAHPYISAGAFFAAGVILIYFVVGSKPAPKQAPQSGGNQAAALQSEALQAQYSAQLSQQQTQLQSVATQVNGAVAISGNQKDVSLAQIANAGTVDLAAVSAKQAIDLAGIAAGASVALGSIAAVVNLGSIDAASRAASDAALYGYLSKQVDDQFTYLTTQSNNYRALQEAAIAAQVVESSNLNNQTVDALQGEILGLGTAVVATNDRLGLLGTTVANEQAYIANLGTAFGLVGINITPNGPVKAH